MKVWDRRRLDAKATFTFRLHQLATMRIEWAPWRSGEGALRPVIPPAVSASVALHTVHSPAAIRATDLQAPEQSGCLHLQSSILMVFDVHGEGL